MGIVEFRHVALLLAVLEVLSAALVLVRVLIQEELAVERQALEQGV